MLHAKEMINMQPKSKQMNQNTKAAEMIKKKILLMQTAINSSFFCRRQT
jgi:hypothetical protein